MRRVSVRNSNSANRQLNRSWQTPEIEANFDFRISIFTSRPSTTHWRHSLDVHHRLMALY